MIGGLDGNIPIDINVLIAFGFGVLLLFLLAKILATPFRLFFRLVVNGVMGGILLWVLNLVGGFIGIHLPINPFTALVAGFMGIPGILVLLAIQYLMVR